MKNKGENKMNVNTKTRCPMCKRFVAERNNSFSHHMGINIPNTFYGRSRKQICFASGYPVNNPQGIIDNYNYLVDDLKQILEEKKRRRENA
jgi:hypothetical protein